MAFRIMLGTLAIVAVTALVATQAVSQEEPGQPTPEEMKKAMEMWIELGKPGPEHEYLQGFVGEWETETRMWMAGPDAPPSVSKGTATFRSIFEGRFVIQETEGIFMGMPMGGMGIMGYDRFRKMFFGTWCDSMSTSMYSFKGSLSRDKTLLSFYGDMDEPALGVIGRMVRYDSRKVSDDEFIFTAYDLHVGEDYKAFEITYKRKK